MIYFDNAATTFPKPQAVIDHVSLALSSLGGNPGRSAHRLAMLAEYEVFACRSEAAKMFSCSPERVIFTQNTTCALNLAMRSTYRDGAIIISDLEHNSVRRPAIAISGDVRIFDSFIEERDEKVRIERILDSISQKCVGAKMLCCTAASNICGATLPIREIGSFCRERDITFIVDGAQAGGTLRLDLEKDNIDILCLPGHKGLYGPMGVGLLLLSDKIEPEPMLLGGSGVDSLSETMPRLPPERYEAGTLPFAAIAGLRAGIAFVNSRGIESIASHEKALSRRLIDHLSELGGVRVLCPERLGSIVLFRLCDREVEETAALLDRAEICVRAGYHCSPLAHSRLSSGRGGAVRVSFSAFNTFEEVDELADALGSMRKKA